jgi:hypothetical protein
VLAAASGGAVDLSSASDLQVKQAVSYLLSNPATEELQDRLSVKSELEMKAGYLLRSSSSCWQTARS